MRSRRFYEAYFGFGSRPAKRYDDGALMLYNAEGFALALGANTESIAGYIVEAFWKPDENRDGQRGCAG